MDSFGVFLEAFLVPTDVDLDLDGAAAMAMVDTAMVDIKVAHFIKEQSTNLAKNITLKDQQLLSLHILQGKMVNFGVISIFPDLPLFLKRLKGL